jgi:hypothetical protein
MEQFKIEIALAGEGRFYDIKALGGNRYEIYDQEQKVGTIEIDEDDHEHCRAVDCEIDLPLMHAIRQGILLHEELNSNQK